MVHISTGFLSVLQFDVDRIAAAASLTICGGASNTIMIVGNKIALSRGRSLCVRL